MKIKHLYKGVVYASPPAFTPREEKIQDIQNKLLAYLPTSITQSEQLVYFPSEKLAEFTLDIAEETIIKNNTCIIIGNGIDPVVHFSGYGHADVISEGLHAGYEKYTPWGSFKMALWVFKILLTYEQKQDNKQKQVGKPQRLVGTKAFLRKICWWTRKQALQTATPPH